MELLKTDVKTLKEERATLRAWAAGVIACITFITISVNAIAASGVVSKVQELIDRPRPVQGPVGK